MVPRISVFLALVFVLVTVAAAEDRIEITPFTGYRLGGGISDPFTGFDLDVDDSSSYGLLVSFAVSEGAWIELLYSHQESELQEDDFLGGLPLFDLDVDYYHIGGLFEWGLYRVKPFLLASAGVTRFDPEVAGRSSETQFSIGLGGGVKLFINDHLGFRFEGRGYSTFIDGQDQVFCDPFGCFVYEDTDTLWQFETKGGLVFRF